MQAASCYATCCAVLGGHRDVYKTFAVLRMSAPLKAALATVEAQSIEAELDSHSVVSFSKISRRGELQFYGSW